MESEKDSARSSLSPLALLGILASWIALVSIIRPPRKPNKNCGKADHPENTTTDPDDSAPRQPTTIVQVPPSPSDSNNANRRKNDAPLWEKLAAMAVAIGTLGLLVVNIFLWCSTKKAADAAKSSADTARQTFVVGQRPWVKIQPRILQPLTFDQIRANGPAAILTVEYMLENIGQSVALEVFPWVDLIPLDPPSAVDPLGLKTARDRRDEWCETNRHRKIAGYVLFPHDPPIPQEADIGALMVDVHKAADANTGDLRGRVGFALVGCVVYRSSFEDKTAPAHETKFMYLMGEPVGGPIKPYVKPIGVASKLRLVVWPDGFSAD